MATRTVSNGGGSYNSTGTWVEGAVPTSADDVVFTATSGNLVINTTSAAKTVNMTSYTGTISGTSTWTVSGNVTLVTAATFSGSWTMIINATATLTSNGKTFNNAFTWSGTNTTTLADNWIWSGTVTFSTTTLNRTSAGVGESTFKGTISAGTVTGTSKFTFDGCSITSPNIANVMEVNTTSGTFNITGSNFIITGTSFTYVAGNTNCNTSTVKVYGVSTLNVSGANTGVVTSSSGINFYNLTLGQPATNTGVVTLSSNITTIGTFTTNNTGNTTVVCNGSTIYCSGNLVSNTAYGGGSAAAIIGTSTLVISGTGTWSCSASVAASVNLNMTINTAGTFTVSSNVYFNNATMTYTAGTVVTTGSTLWLFSVLSSAVTLNTAGITWNNVANFSGSSTLTLNSLLTVSGNMIICNITNPGTNAITFAGSYGFTAGTLYSVTYAATNVIFVSGVTYTAGNILCYPTGKGAASNMVFKATTPGSVAYLTITTGPNAIILIDGTDIDSSGGKTIRTFRGTLSNTTNWITFTYTDHPVIAYTSCN